MWKSGDVKLLLSLLLIPGLLVSCGLEKEGYLPHPKHELTAKISNPEDQNLEQPLNDIQLEESFKDIQETYKQFHELLENFLGEIDKLSAYSNNLELIKINTYEINQKLKEIEAKISQYKKNWQTTDAQDSEIFDGINLIINKIKPITEQLKEGLAKESIGKVQIYLGNIVSGPSDQFYGVSGPNTRIKIRASLTKNSQQLKAKIIALGEISGFIKPSVPPTNLDNLARKIADLEARNEELVTIAQFKTIRRKMIFDFIIIVLVLATVLIVLCLSIGPYRRRIKRIWARYKKNFGNTKIQSNVVNKASNLDTQELIDQVDDRLKEMYNSWDAETKKIQSQIYNLQQNQQVKTPGNNVDNKKLIVQVVNDKIGEIYRQLQQEIDQRWDLKSRNLQNQINQLQQNQQLKTSDNNADNKKLIFEAVKEEIHGQLQQEIHKRLDIELRNLPNQINQPQQNQQLKTPDNIAGGLPNLEFMLIYKEDPRSLLENAIEVSEADRSMVQPRISSTQAVILQKVRRGNYWILNEADIDYMVPRHNIKINEYNSKTIANLFECQGYQSEYSGFQLIKPAKVSAISKGETWQLVERGILQFD